MRSGIKGIIFVLFLVIGFMPAVTVNAEEIKGTEFWYELNEAGEATLTSGIKGYIKSGRLEIPAQIDGHPVVAIGEGFSYYETALTELILPGSVKELGDRCFIGADNLTKVTFHEGLEKIGSQAFFHCGLTNFTLPSTVKEVGSSAFGYFKASSVTMPASVETWGQSIFYGSSTLKNITFQDGFSKIRKRILGVTSADRIEIPATVTEIEEEAFWETNIQSLRIYGKDGKIGNRAFLQVEDVYCYRDSTAYNYFVESNYNTNIHIMGPYLEKEDYKLKVGESAQLKLLNGSGSSSWSSSDSTVVAVSGNGNITALKPGTVTVTVVTGDTTLTAKVVVADLKFKEKTASVTVGYKVKLQLEGGKKIKWKSSNNKVATITQKGVVKGKKKGTVTITATCNNKKYQCKVKVKENMRSLSGYSTNPAAYPYNSSALGFKKVKQDKKGNYVVSGHFINNYSQTAAYIGNLTVVVKRNGKVIAKQTYDKFYVNTSAYRVKAITITILKKNVKKADLRTGTVTVDFTSGKVYG